MDISLKDIIKAFKEVFPNLNQNRIDAFLPQMDHF